MGGRLPLGSGFGLLLTARLTSRLGSAMAPVGLAFAVLQATGRAGDLGLALTAQQLPTVLLVLAGGVLGDRVRRRERVLVAADTVAGIGQAATAALVLTGGVTLLPLCALQALSGAASAFAAPALLGLVPSLVPAARLQRANASLGITRNVALLAGAPLGGLLAAVADPGWALAADAASYLVSATCLLALALGPLRHHARIPAGPRAGVVADLREGVQIVREQRWLWVVIAQFSLLLGLGEGGYAVLGPVVSRDAYGGAGAYGALLAVQGAGSIAGAVVAARASWRRPLLVATIGTLPTPGLLALLAAPAALPVVLVAGLVVGLGFGVFGVVWNTAVQQHVPPHALSRVAALDALGSFALIPLGTALIGVLAGPLGIRGTLLLCVAGALLPTVAALAVRDVRELPALPPRAAAIPALATEGPAG